ncbi:lipopolysaccharide biosynthesis protein [Thiorhodovibrio winogradskyi]|uniref:lipopolysaccharide biosynthesis protein n=1 Tax=Thiorhodovibrio winogradskyi TaxID=77007 RepID=UPI002E2E17EE|nr:lipopolysaccharide biosynthesis protein [Thiorhodovibrio winogradskyi]
MTFVAQGFKFVIQLTSIAVLARLLSPSDFGLVAMVTILTGLLSKFMDGGLSMATIQRPDVTQGQISNLFWINVALGLLLTILTIACAPALALVYDEPRLTWIGVVLSMSFLIGGLAVQHTALLKRQMQFKVLARIDVISMTCGVLAGIVSAWGGLGYWSLVILTLSTTASQVILVWLASDWCPGAPLRGTGVRPMLRFGISLTGANFVGYLASNLTPFVVGLVGGAQQLGLYNRANTLTAIPSTQILPPVMNVAQPALCRVAGDPERFRRAALSLIRKVSLLTMFITVSMVVLADWIVDIFLGPGWDAAVPMFRLLAVFSLVEPVATITSILLIAAGKANALLKWKLMTLGIIAVSVAIGSIWGSMGIIAAYSLSGLLIRLPFFLVYASRHIPVSRTDFLNVFLPFLALALFLLLALIGLRSSLEIVNATTGIVIFLPVALVFYLLAGLTIKDVRIEIMDIYQTTLVTIKGRKG